MNRENIQKVRDHIASLPPAQFDMGTFGFRSSCGTVACICGWANVLAGKDQKLSNASAAGSWLGLDGDQSDLLFDMDLMHEDASTEDAVRVLDHLLETGEVDWSIIDAPSPSSDRGGS